MAKSRRCGGCFKLPEEVSVADTQCMDRDEIPSVDMKRSEPLAAAVKSALAWPELRFPPINLWNAPVLDRRSGSQNLPVGDAGLVPVRTLGA